jgi:HlyD family secretion protein
MKKWLVPVVTVGGLVAVGYLAWIAFLAPDPVEVRVAPVTRGEVAATVTNSKAGTIEARRRARLSTGTSGIVVELAAKRSERVTAGAVLLRLDDSTQRAALLLAQRSLEVAEATNQRACLAADRALRELERNRKLADDNIVSVDVLDELESAHDLAVADCGVARSRVEEAHAGVEAAMAELDKTVLRAPFDAVIAEVSVEIGEWVTPSVPLLAAPDVIDAIDTASLYVSAPMDEVDAALLRVGQPVRVSIDPYPDREFRGRVHLVAPYVLDLEQQNRTIEVEVVLYDQEFSATLLPGTSADVEVILDAREDVLRIPSSTLLEGQRVLVIEDGVLVERQVELGLRNWEWAEVTAGLQAGEEVVTSLDRPGVEAGAEARVLEGEPRR